jgi:hypothetical protein
MSFNRLANADALRRPVKPLVMLMLLAAGSSANAGSFDGSWAYGKFGHFSLELVARRDLVCGQVTSVSGQKVDASLVIGRVEGQRAFVQFASAFGEGSAKGTAKISPTKRGMEWRVVQSPPGESWILESAHAAPAPWGKGRRAALAKVCAEYWGAIEQGNTGGIELRP